MATKKKTKTVKKKRAKKAARKRKVNKSQAVRDYLASHPDAGPTEVCKALADKGIKVSPQQVSTIKSSSKKKAGKKAGKKPGRRKQAAAGGRVSVAELVTAKDFADRVGGVANAQELLAALGKLG